MAGVIGKQPAQPSGNEIPMRKPWLLPGLNLPRRARLGQGTEVPGDILANPKNPMWRRRLRRASFKGMPFYVEQQGRTSGRRVVTFEYPKRDVPFTEDMGRHAMRYQMTGYLVQAPRNPLGMEFSDVNYAPPGLDYNSDAGLMPRDYDLARDNLEMVLFSPGPGVLNDPYNPRLSLPGYGNRQVLWYCERYTIIEQKEKGGFCMLEMSFVEAGTPGNNLPDSASAAAAGMVAAIQATLMAASLEMRRQVDAANKNKQAEIDKLTEQFAAFKTGAH